MAANMFFMAAGVEAAQVDDFTPSEPDTSDEFTIQAVDDAGGDATISFTVGATQTVAAVTAGLKAAADAAKAAGTKPWDKITAVDATTKLTLTVDTAGKPVTYTANATGGETLTAANVTAASGPSIWTQQANWDGGDGDLPGADADDSVYIDGGQDENAILYGLAQGGITNALVKLDVTRMQIGDVGDVGEAPYYLAIKSALVDINKTPSVGSPTLRAPVNINAGATATTFTVWDSGTVSGDATEPGVNLLANSASSKAYIKKGNVGIASHNGEAAVLSETNVEGGKTVIGSGVTLTTHNQIGGETVMRCACGTVDVTKGTLTHEGTNGITTKITVRGGMFIGNSSGTLAEVDSLGGVTDFIQSKVPHTITLWKVAAGATIKFNPARTTVTAFQFYDTAGNLQLTVTKLT